MSDQPRQYIDGIFVREKEGRYGPFFSVGIDVEKIVEQAKKHGDGKFLNVTFSKRREKSDKGISHSVSLDTYRKENAARQFGNAHAAADRPASPASEAPPDPNDDVPFN
jgi:hypothetical protein